MMFTLPLVHPILVPEDVSDGNIYDYINLQVVEFVRGNSQHIKPNTLRLHRAGEREHLLYYQRTLLPELDALRHKIEKGKTSIVKAPATDNSVPEGSTQPHKNKLVPSNLKKA